MVEENEKKKEYLKGYRDNVEAANRIEEQIRELRADKLYPSYILSDMPRSYEKKDLSDYAAKLYDLIEELKRTRFKRIDTYTKISRQMELMENERERQVLKYRYIDGHKWEDIAARMNVEWTQIHRLHKKALEKFKIPN